MVRFITAGKIVKRKLKGMSFNQLAKQQNLSKDIRIG